MHTLKFPRRLEGYDGRAAITGDITQVAEVVMDLQGHVERLFLYVTKLSHYPIVLGHPWLARHGAIADFASNTLSLASLFCLTNCCLHPVKIESLKEQFVTPHEEV